MEDWEAESKVKFLGHPSSAALSTSPYPSSALFSPSLVSLRRNLKAITPMIDICTPLYNTTIPIIDS